MQNNHAERNAAARLATIMELITAAKNAKTDKESEKIQENIFGEALAVSAVRHYEIELSTGGPACRITGRLDDHGAPETACLEFRDWGTPWTKLPTKNAKEQNALLDFASHFYFDDGRN